MSVRRRVTLAATIVAVAGLSATALGSATTSSAAPATTSATAAVGNPKVLNAHPCCGRTFLGRGFALSSSDPTGSSMMSGGLGAGPDATLTTFSSYRLELQGDGNMVEYDGTAAGRRAVWSTGTQGAAVPISLALQSDGNVVLRDRTGRAIWATGTAGRPTEYFDVYGNGQLVAQDAAGRVLSASGPAEVGLPGMRISGADSPAYVAGGTYRAFVPQSDGNLVAYVVSGRTQRAVWSSGTAGVGPVHLDAQDDGNVVLYRTDGVHRTQAVWSTGIRH